MMSAAGERALNEALADAQIGATDDEFLAIVERFYAEHVQVSREATPGRLIGRAQVKHALARILGPLLVFANAEGRSATLRYLPIYSDRRDEHHSAWSLELVGSQGRRAAVRWCVRRIWRRGQVVHEHFYENDMNGQTLMVDDLWTKTSAALPRA
jgi:hypothetical protein